MLPEKRMLREGGEGIRGCKLLFPAFTAFARHIGILPSHPGARAATRPGFHAAVGFSFTCSVCVGKANSKPARSNSSFTRKFKACKPRK